MTMDELSKIMADCRDRERALLRGESEMIEAMECPICHRKPTVTSGGYGKTYYVCQHTMDAITRLCKPAEPMSMGAGGLAPLGLHPLGVRLALLDDDGQTGRTG